MHEIHVNRLACAIYIERFSKVTVGTLSFVLLRRLNTFIALSGQNRYKINICLLMMLSFPISISLFFKLWLAGALSGSLLSLFYHLFHIIMVNLSNPPILCGLKSKYFMLSCHSQNSISCLELFTFPLAQLLMNGRYDENMELLYSHWMKPVNNIN